MIESLTSSTALSPTRLEDSSEVAATKETRGAPEQRTRHRRNRTSWMSAVMGLLLALLGNGCDISTCTDIGCADGVVASLRTESGTWPDGAYTLAITLDETHTQCSFRLPDDVHAGTGQVQSCGLGALLELPVSSEARVRIGSNPSQLTIELTRDGNSVLVAAPELKYGDSYPNGPDCGRCRSATVRLTVAD
jgi:hypothetical protein